MYSRIFLVSRVQVDWFRITAFFGSQDLQRRLDLERAERNKTDSATLKLLSELKEDSQKANELRDQESRLADKQSSKKISLLLRNFNLAVGYQV